jgi:hypothetical protein
MVCSCFREIAWPLASLQTASDFVADRATHPRKKQGWVATIVEPRQKKDKGILWLIQNHHRIG